MFECSWNIFQLRTFRLFGAPKEYYDGRAYLVSTYDIDAIGGAIVKVFNEHKAQLELRNYILNNYSFDVLSKKLHQVFQIRL